MGDLRGEIESKNNTTIIHLFYSGNYYIWMFFSQCREFEKETILDCNRRNNG
jgi:hypothetical protein